MVNKKKLYVAIKEAEDVEEFTSDSQEFTVETKFDEIGNCILMIKQGYEVIAMFADWLFWRYGDDES